MKLFINDRFVGVVKSYEHNEAFTGWIFNFESGSRVFVPFSNIRRFNSCGVLDILTW